MYALLLILHLLICLGLIGVVLIQSGKGGGLAGGAFGGSAQTVFGGRGATDIITRATMVLGCLFFVTSLVLALMTTGQRGPGRSIIQEEARKAASGQQPATLPGGAAPAPAPAGTAPSGGTAPTPAGGTPSAPAGGTAPAPSGGTAPAPTATPAPATTPPAGGK